MSAGLLAFLLMTGAAGAAFVALRPTPGEQRRLEAELRALALTLGGRLVRAGRLGPPELELDSPIGPVRCCFRHVGAEGTIELTELRLLLPRLVADLYVRPGALRYRETFAAHRDDVELGVAAFDARFLLRGRVEDELRGVMDEGAQQALTALFDQLDGTVELRAIPSLDTGFTELVLTVDRWLTDSFSLEPAHARLVALGEQLMRSWERPWAQHAYRLGLSRSDGPLQPGRAAFVGTAQGFELRLEECSRDGELRTELWVSVGLPFEIEVLERGLADEQGWGAIRDNMGNPVLDMLVAVRCSAPDACRALLADDEITGRLLPVVHGRPGSRLTERGVDLVQRGYPIEGLDTVVDEALSLARALRVGLERLADEAGGGS